MRRVAPAASRRCADHPHLQPAARPLHASPAAGRQQPVPLQVLAEGTELLTSLPGTNPVRGDRQPEPYVGCVDRPARPGLRPAPGTAPRRYRQARRLRLRCRSAPSLLVARGERLPFADGTFDALSFTYLLRYVSDPGATIRELARVVRPGGCVANLEFAVPGKPWWHAGWVAYTRAVLPLAGLFTGGREWYEVGRFLGPSISTFLPEVPGLVAGGRMAGRRSARGHEPADEPRRRPGHVGAQAR